MNSAQGTEHMTAPRARLAFRVGIVGHRPNRLEQADEAELRRVMHKLLNHIHRAVVGFSDQPSRSLYSADRPVLRAISPLAEGTDRIFAEEALALKFELCCPMPFAQEVYERDFSGPGSLEENSVDRFRKLLQRAATETKLTKFELNVDVPKPHDPYGDAGRIVLNQSDILIVVWDHEPAVGAGSTVYTLEEALRENVPVVVIDAFAPHQWRVVREKSDVASLRSHMQRSENNWQPDLVAIDKIVRAELTVPAPEPTDSHAKHNNQKPPLYEDYFHQRKAAWHPWFVWKFFRDIVSTGRAWPKSFRVGGYVESIRNAWPTRADRVANQAPSTPETTAEWTNDRLREHYAWSDKPADIFGDKYRSTYVIGYLFAALAVMLALWPVAMGWGDEQHTRQTVLIVGEFICLSTIIGLVVYGRWRRWHEHWIEYRILAELIRQFRLLIPLGGARPFPRLPSAAHLADYGDLRQTWMYWHMRAIARDTGIPNARQTPAFLDECAQYLAGVAGRVVAPTGVSTDHSLQVEGGQFQFHAENADRSAKIERRLYVTALTFLWMTVAAVIWHFFRHLSHTAAPVDSIPLAGAGDSITPATAGDSLHSPSTVEKHSWTDGWLLLASGAFPAVGAALAGIENQGEFARLHKRSHAMSNAYSALAVRLHDFLNRPPAHEGSAGDANDLTAIAIEMAQLMMDEVADWRVMFKDRPQREP